MHAFRKPHLRPSQSAAPSFDVPGLRTLLTWCIAGLVLTLVAACGEADDTVTGLVDVTTDVGGGGGDVPISGDLGSDAVAGCTENSDCADAFADLGICEVAICSEGACQRDFAPLDQACDDGDACTSGDRCAQDSSGAVTCQPTVGCDDGDACNGVETCEASGCVAGTALNCDDSNPCTTDSCDSTSGCTYQAAEGQAGCCDTAADCNDGNPCTTDSCEGGACQFADSTGACDTGDPCAPNGMCVAGECSADNTAGCGHVCTLSGKAGDIVDCPLGLARLTESGAAATSLTFNVQWTGGDAALNTLLDPFCIGDNCLNAAIPQANTSLEPSGHVVTLDPAAPASWGGTLGVSVNHDSDASISPAYFDNDALIGEAVVFVLRFQLKVDTEASEVLLGDLATTAAGTPLVTGFVGTNIVTDDVGCGGSLCFDGSPCTEDVCTVDVCTYESAEGACDDGNPCTTGDVCTETGCEPGQPSASGTPCTGANLCSGAGLCDGAGECVIDAGAAVTCDDSGLDCVSLACDPLTGSCVPSADSGATCDDGNACTTGDLCGADGSCSGIDVVCDDGTNCSVNVCNPASGCSSVPSGTTCDDGNPCTDDSCGESGCEYTVKSGGCDDGNACTYDDACNANGLCEGQKYPVMNAGCPCVNDGQCAPLDDGNLCTGTVACISGSCQTDPSTVVVCASGQLGCEVDATCQPDTGNCVGTPKDCDDENDCTADSCSPSDGCVHTLLDSCPTGFICEISGPADSVALCEIRLVRGGQADAIPSGADVTLHWDSTKLALENLVDEFCVGNNCFPFDVVTCAEDGTQCQAEDLEPTGHELIVVPKNIASWTNKLALATYHAGESGKALTGAYKDGVGTVVGDALILTARFKLKTAIAAGTPERIGVSNVHFNPGSGLEMTVTLEDLDVGRAFVATEP